jgi:hypothetical protein
MPDSRPVSRRKFLERGATTAAVTVVARHVLGGPRFVAPSDRINVAYVGTGTQGLRQLMPALQRDDLRITAVCDPNRRSENYVEWARFELRDKIRGFLGDPSWAEGARSCPCGREVGRELVDRHYGASPGAGCRSYADFRELIATEGLFKLAACSATTKPSSGESGFWRLQQTPRNAARITMTKNAATHPYMLTSVPDGLGLIGGARSPLRKHAPLGKHPVPRRGFPRNAGRPGKIR